jgi:sec-independent protein translocase protein TatA
MVLDQGIYARTGICNWRSSPMPNFGPTELLIILVIVILLFGVGRIGRIFGELGHGFRAFRTGLKEPDAEVEKTE